MQKRFMLHATVPDTWKPAECFDPSWVACMQTCCVHTQHMHAVLIMQSQLMRAVQTHAAYLVGLKLDAVMHALAGWLFVATVYTSACTSLQALNSAASMWSGCPHLGCIHACRLFIVILMIISGSMAFDTRTRHEDQLMRSVRR